MSQRMHEVQQAVHDAEEEEAASGAGDSTGGQPLCCRPPRKRRDIPLSSAGTRLCISPASAAVLACFPGALRQATDTWCRSLARSALCHPSGRLGHRRQRHGLPSHFPQVGCLLVGRNRNLLPEGTLTVANAVLGVGLSRDQARRP